jgi:hypothetical protein
MAKAHYVRLRFSRPERIQRVPRGTLENFNTLLGLDGLMFALLERDILKSCGDCTGWAAGFTNRDHFVRAAKGGLC